MTKRKLPAPKPSTARPRGKKLTTAEKAMRDMLMLSRRMQGWTWEAVAQEADITQAAARAAVKKQREAMPNLLGQEAVQIAQNLAEQWEASIAAFEAMAVEFSTKNPNAAIGARRGADNARMQLMKLLQALGKLPRELGTIRHLIDLRATVEVIVRVIDDFEDRVSKADLPARQRKPLVEAAQDVKRQLAEVAGADSG